MSLSTLIPYIILFILQNNIITSTHFYFPFLFHDLTGKHIGKENNFAYHMPDLFTLQLLLSSVLHYTHYLHIFRI